MRLIKINSKNPEKDRIQKAADIIKNGGVVVFPTETVYGIGVNALNKKAVSKIFKIKGRPKGNPLIVHIAKKEDIFNLAKNIPKEADLLINKFWPGPLTLVLEKKKIIPDNVTAKSQTVALRMPQNKIALNLIVSAGVPMAAPSANISGRPSSTAAIHALSDFKEKVDLIIDGGRAKIGLESTVVDLTKTPFLILRKGAITKEGLEKVLGRKLFYYKKNKKEPLRSPGMAYRHYSPKAKLILAAGTLNEIKKKIKKSAEHYKKSGKKVGILASNKTKNFYKGDVILCLGSRKNLKIAAKNLFNYLRFLDKEGVDIILAESFPRTGIGTALMDRLSRAASKII